jgi:hypothetical protein
VGRNVWQECAEDEWHLASKHIEQNVVQDIGLENAETMLKRRRSTRDKHEERINKDDNQEG